jgi:hypothetical protein
MQMAMRGAMSGKTMFPDMQASVLDRPINTILVLELIMA